MRMNTSDPEQGDGYVDDESTLQPPPSELDSVDVGGDDEEAPAQLIHDQLPSPEEYKAKMKDGSTSSGFFGNNSSSPSDIKRDNPQDGGYDNNENGGNASEDNIHDQLPSVDEYKSSMSFRQQGDSGKKSRAGLYTFLGLLLVTIIATAIAVPLALNNQQNRTTGSNTSQVNTGSSGDDGSSPSSSTGGSRPAYNPPTPTLAPVRPPVTETTGGGGSGSSVGGSDKTRLEQTIDYLVKSGVVDQSVINQATSPQAEAAFWIANEDQYQMDIPAIAQADVGGADPIPHTHSPFTERWALAVFYFATNGKYWRYQLKFLEPIDHCDWYETFIDNSGSIIKMGVTGCDTLGSEEKYIQKIELSNNLLSGSIPKEIQYIHRLTDFIVPFNAGLVKNSSLDGLLTLSYLEHLELQYCGLTGTIPDDFGTLGSLTFLGLGNNFMEGPIPESFFRLTNLLVLGLDDNLLESPLAPFAQFVNMEKMYLEDNVITGQVTEEMIRDWQKMVDLDLSVNRLEGPIPANIWSMPNLEVLDLHGNDFVGAIPEIESVHDKMTFFAVQDNNIEWRIPESISNLINLAHLDISANSMAIPFPSTMAQLSNLRSFYTGINPFEEHPIPDFLAGMTSLRELSMKQNMITGTIPSFLGGLTNLQVLDLDFNDLKGTIPSELGLVTGIDTIMLNRNYLTGTIPSSFSNLNDLDVLLLDGNSLTGNSDVICTSPTINTTFFSSDCGEPNPEIECTCCHLCCNDNNSTCNNYDWRVNLDGIWEYDYQRVVYSFTQSLLPADAKNSYLLPENEAQEKNDGD